MRGTPLQNSINIIDSVRATGKFERRPRASKIPNGNDTTIAVVATTRVIKRPPQSLVSTFDKSKSDEITNDIQHCRMLVKEHSNVVEDIVFWVFSPDGDTKSTKMNRKCLENRGHSVIN